jgi:RimJ/RimL family protein N-acetyltransferase
MTRVSLPTPTLHTARLRLRPFDDADANDLFALHSSGYVLRYWDAPPWSERVRAGRFIAACRQTAEGGSEARLAVDRGSDGVHRLVRSDPVESGLPQRIAGLLLRRYGVGPRLRDGGLARSAEVGLRHAGPESRPG